MKQYKRSAVVSLLMWACTVAMVMASTSAAFAQAPDREFTISVGETLTFSGRGVRSVSIGLPQIADAQVADNRQLIVTGKQPGTTTINIYGEDQKTLLIRVVGTNPQSLAEEVREVLGPGSGVDVRVVKGRVLLEGEVAGEKFKQKIESLTDLYPNQVLNFTTYREAFVEGARMVAVDIYFVQLATTNRDQLGVKWGQFIGSNYTFGSGDVPLYYGNADLQPGVTPDNTGSLLSEPAELTGGEGLGSYWSLVGQVNVALDFLVENGLIKTVNHGTLVTEVGKEANYHNGGTILIPISNISSTGVSEVPYGLNVNMVPIVDAEGNVKLEIELDYSELDYANGVEELPALRNNQINTVVNTQAGQSVLVSSQENLNDTSNETGWWMLSRIPILGWLFKSRNRVGTTLDNALFVTPRLYEPGNRSHDQMIDGVFKQLIDAGAEPTDLPELEDAEPRRRSNENEGVQDERGGQDDSAEVGPSLLE